MDNGTGGAYYFNPETNDYSDSVEGLEKAVSIYNDIIANEERKKADSEALKLKRIKDEEKAKKKKVSLKL